MLYDEWLKHPTCNITNDGSSGNDGYIWGRGPNTLYSPTFTKYANRYISILNTVKYYDDDIFYGAISKKYNIKYVDLHNCCMYIFHSQISPLSSQSKMPFSFLAKYFLEAICCVY